MKIDYKEQEEFWNERAKVKDERKAVTLVSSPYFARYIDQNQKREILNAYKVGRDMRVLDLGCGNGRWSIKFAENCAEVVGIDISQKLINVAQKKAKEKNLNNIKFIKGLIINLPQLGKKFDMVFFGWVLMYLNEKDVENILEKITQYLKEDYAAVVLDSFSLKCRKITKSKKDYSAIYRAPKELITTFSRHGFKLVYRKDISLICIPNVIYTRLVPSNIKEKKLIQLLFKSSLTIQLYLNPLLYKIKPIVRVSQYLKRKFSGISHQVLVFNMK